MIPDVGIAEYLYMINQSDSLRKPVQLRGTQKAVLPVR